MWSGEIFLRNFLPYPPPNIPGLKGGDVFIIVYTLVMIWKSWDHPQLWDILGVVPSRSLLSEDMVLIRSTITATRMLEVPKFSLGANGAVAFSRGLMYVMNLLIIHIYIWHDTHSHIRIAICLCQTMVAFKKSEIRRFCVNSITMSFFFLECKNACVYACVCGNGIHIHTDRYIHHIHNSWNDPLT